MSEEPEQAARGKILIVDDTAANIEILYKILKGEFDVLFAKSGADGMRMVREHTPDLVLLDVMMPDMDGYEVCRLLKRDPATARMPVVFVTAMGNDEDETRGLELGAIDYLTKPIRPPIVLARVRNHLELKRRGDLLEQLSAELARKNLELEVLAREDGLTGVANRRHFDEALRSEVQRATRNGRNLSLIMCDIDRFKQFNDLYGHLAGDSCLQLVGELLRKSFKRAGEVVARYGGEEFAVILPDTSAELAGHLAERLRLELMGQALPHAQSEFGVVTMSLGVGGGLATRDHNVEWYICSADGALYRSKAGGRNRVSVWEDQ
ncbi:diguanylate cyclase [Geomonas sp. Red69]|uniref:diguanylate cyclase n=1 Tax=Geomonas diazotrophica TaxID=2843197 RepID=A0ABX8JFS2_9BACT|nr:MULTISPECIES: diguanylate cyclase [Geomonas]MBU5637784.1 diguanylate cyclase [Geomonas diazotrophica]QWV96317.1 diguanylate cyclase [Geomonas nitrogeniifigens]QXE85384.1 diguanylate cyclase [Geomonas nitrogeniifigens]